MNKKAGIIILAGIVLVGCIFAAGCTTGDPIIGVWTLTEPTDLGIQENEGYDVYKTFLQDGTGYDSYYGSGSKYDSTDSSISYVSGYSGTTISFIWIKNNDGTYTLSFTDDEVIATYDDKAKTLTTNWGVYTKIV